MCGEKARAYCKIYNEWGSPPHVRGKEDEPQFIADFLRITPACAGKSCLILLWAGLARDHPRMCGEKTKKIP